MIVEHRENYDRNGRNLELANEEDLGVVRHTQQHRRRRRRGAAGLQQRWRVIPFLSTPPPPGAAKPDAIVVSSDDDEEEGATQRGDLAQFVSAWVRRWPSRSARSMIEGFGDIAADDRERLRDLLAAGVESERRLAEAILAEATRVVRRRGTVVDIYEALHGLLWTAVNRPLR